MCNFNRKTMRIKRLEDLLLEFAVFNIQEVIAKLEGMILLLRQL